MVRHQIFITQSSQETSRVGEELGNYLKQDKKGKSLECGKVKRQSAEIICLYGDLGSGKTTFVQGLAKGLGIMTRLLSPTFIIVRRYKLARQNYFYHLDLYRLHSGGELPELGIQDIFTDNNCIVAVEWAEKMGVFLPQRRIDIHFQVLENGTHKIKIADIN